VDAGCWNSEAAAHELMHNFGGVQPTAPHATPSFHCYDEYDRMCYRDGSGMAMQYLCPSSHDALFDCNHDDYFNTNPAPDNYLAAHWNTANNLFLIGAQPTAQPLTVDVLITGVLNRKGQFVATDTFKRNDTVVVQSHVHDALGASVPNVQITLRVDKPDGSALCTLVSATDPAGNTKGTCALSRAVPPGQWQADLGNASKPGYALDPASTTKHAFRVTGK
jgi:hypothetical protein